MSDYIKVPINIFEMEQVKNIEDSLNADSVLVIWFQLICKAKQKDSDTIINFTKDQYSLEKFLSVILHREKLEMRKALEKLKDVGAVEIIPNGIKVNRFWLTNQEWRNTSKYKEWRTRVFERDKYTCQDCGSKGGYLEAHHIMSFAQHEELRFEIDNGITLCKSCHRSRHRNGDNNGNI